MAGRAIPDDAPIRPRAARGPGWLVWQVLSHLRRPRRCTGLAPAEPRPRRWAETQRNDTLALVADHAALIHDAASRHRVPGEAVGGVILWEGLENPARRRLGRFALGKVRPTEFWRPAESQLVEREGRVPGPVGLLGRVLPLRQPEWAI
jgi:hypothetical protein